MWGTDRALGPAGRVRSDLDVLRDFQGVVEFDPQVSDGALELRMAEEKLDGSEVVRLAVDQRHFRPAQ